MTVAFTGTRLDWIGTKATNYGIAKVTVDGGAPIDVDLYATFAFKQKIWSTGTLADGAHIVKVEWTGTKNASSSGTYFNVDAFDVLGTLTQATSGPAMARHEETSSLLAYDGTWSSTTNAGLSGGSSTSANSGDSAVTVAFTGTRLDWIGAQATNYGIAKVTVDGGAPMRNRPLRYLRVQAEDLVHRHACRRRPYRQGRVDRHQERIIVRHLLQCRRVRCARHRCAQATSGPAMARHEETETPLAFVGSWSTVNSPSLSAGS